MFPPRRKCQLGYRDAVRLLSGALLVLALLSLPAAPTSAAPEFTCQGRAATVVGEVGRSVRGTDGDDVIVTNGAKHVSAGRATT